MTGDRPVSRDCKAEHEADQVAISALIATRTWRAITHQVRYQKYLLKECREKRSSYHSVITRAVALPLAVTPPVLLPKGEPAYGAR